MINVNSNETIIIPDLEETPMNTNQSIFFPFKGILLYVCLLIYMYVQFLKFVLNIQFFSKLYVRASLASSGFTEW